MGRVREAGNEGGRRIGDGRARREGRRVRENWQLGMGRQRGMENED